LLNQIAGEGLIRRGCFDGLCGWPSRKASREPESVCKLSLFFAVPTEEPDSMPTSQPTWFWKPGHMPTYRE
jgi:hypothetical protein